MYNLVMCDDNDAAIINTKDIVEKLYENLFDIKIAHGFREIDTSRKIDILLMDIELNPNEKNGIQTASLLKEKQKNMQVIFISSFHEYAEEIFNANPVYYVQKPVNEESLKKALEKAINNLESDDGDYFNIQNSGEIITVRIRDILYFESQLRKVKLVTADRKVAFFDKLDNVESKINEMGVAFIRTHKSFLVNADRISSLTTDTVELDTQTEIPISKNYYQKAKIKFLEHITNI